MDPWEIQIVSDAGSQVGTVTVPRQIGGVVVGLQVAEVAAYAALASLEESLGLKDRLNINICSR